MRRYILLCGCLFTFFHASAQKNALTTADLALTKGELKKAKYIIDVATNNPESKDMPDIWILRGKIYHEIYQEPEREKAKAKATKIEYQEKPSLDSLALDKAYIAFMKAIELGEKEEKDKATAKGKQPKPYSERKSIINEMKKMPDEFKRLGIEFYQKSNVERAFTLLEIGLTIDEIPEIKVFNEEKRKEDEKDRKERLKNQKDGNEQNVQQAPTPEVFIYYAAVMADQIKQYDKALKYYNKCLELKYGIDMPVKDKEGKEKEVNGKVVTNSLTAADIYVRKANIMRIKGDTLAAVALDEEAFGRFKSDAASSLVSVINYYLIKQNSAKTLQFLDEGLKLSPTNANYHYLKGRLYSKLVADSTLKADKAKNQQLASECYQKCIENGNKQIQDNRLAIDSLTKVGNNDDVIERYSRSIENTTRQIGMSNYYIGAVFYQKAVDIFEEANKISTEKASDFQAAKSKGIQELKNALPYYEAAHNALPEEKGFVRGLSVIYDKTGQKDKAEEMKKLLE